ncbi:MAG TPA: FAD-binding oxidoreductase [Nocardioides sp.]|uniref:NAD(P)/FAD-dependent oxidoreductase n=1 Tax=Nocardioides sp. TaxID=35761 RepID=UPI002C6DBAFA|nr:FAD-binding oxidoreductase [Nocardioides sp.]HQR25524.1 FAD-binding oxidoreductase [Nocardioides sp.]
MRSSYDVVVIGGGLLGCSLAWELASDNIDVLLLERDQINQHASGRNAGSLHFQLEYRMIQPGLEAARRAAEAIPLHLRAAELWQLMSREIGPDLGLSQKGGLMLADDADSARLLEAKGDVERDWGLDVRLLDGAEAHALAPYLSDSVVAAAFCPIEGKANARTAAAAIGRAAAAAGAEVRTNSSVTAVERQGSRWSLQVSLPGATAPARHVSCDSVILAAGVWCNELAAMFGASLPVEPIALSMTVTARTTSFIPYLIQHAGARLSLKQTEEGNVLIGGGWPARLPHTVAGAPDLSQAPEILVESLVGNADAAARVVPRVGSLSILRTWAGTTTVAPDQLPVVGPIPGVPGVYVATGGSAFTLGPAFAELLSEMVQGRSPSLDLTPYAVDRFASAVPAPSR